LKLASPSSSYASKVSASQHRLWKQGVPLLGSLDIELTERCNNNCIHCSINLPVNDGEARQREISTIAVKDTLVQAASLGALYVRFTGGEPLLREDFRELYLFARHLGLAILLCTNARLITPELAKLFFRIPPLKKIEITAYGMTRESYEAVTQVPGAFEEFRRGVQLLGEHGVPLVVKGAVLPANRGEIEAFEAWAATLPAMDEPPSYAMFFELRARRNDPVKNRLIKSLRLTPDEGLAILGRRGQGYLKGMREFCDKFMGPPGDRVFVCGAGRLPCVDAYGALQPCLSLRHPDTTYDLMAGSLQDAMTNFFPSLRDKRSTNPDYLERCSRCFLMALCEQCPAKSWAEHGTLDTPVDYFCRVAHAEARYLALIEPGERAWEVKNWKERMKSL